MTKSNHVELLIKVPNMGRIPFAEILEGYYGGVWVVYARFNDSSGVGAGYKNGVDDICVGHLSCHSNHQDIARRGNLVWLE